MRQRLVAALDRFHVRALHLLQIDDEQEFAEVIADGSARVVTGGRESLILRERLGAQRFMDGGALAP